MNKLLLSETSISNEIGGISQFYTQQILAALASEFVEQIVLFGSRAKGSYFDGSDIDICLFGSFSLAHLRELEGKIDELELPWKLDLIGFDQLTNNALKEHIVRVGICLQK